MKKIIAFLFSIIFATTYAQTHEFSLLDQYKYIVVKPKNTHIEFSSAIKDLITKRLTDCGFGGNFIDQSELYNSAYKQCDIITCEYNVMNLSGNSPEISSQLNFLDCNYKVVKSISGKEKFTFYNEKNCIKHLTKQLQSLNTYTYHYRAPENETNANAVAQNTEPMSGEKQEKDETLYRGGSGPMKGLNVNSQKEMVVGKYYALIIGIDTYKNPWNSLVNAVNDAKAIEATLKTQYKFDAFKTLYNEQATRDAIITDLEWLVSNVSEKDNVLIFYSGHGEYKKELGKGYWVPVDATSNSTAKYISNSDLQTYINGIKSKHTLLISDACFSGDIFRGNTVSVPFEESERYYKEVHGLVSRQAITSGGIEPVMDGGKDGHSVFTYYFIKSLNENQAKYYDVSQIYSKIKIPVINNSEQTPKLSPIKNAGDEGGQFIFIRK